MKRQLRYLLPLCLTLLGAVRPASAMKVLRDQVTDAYDRGAVFDQQGQWAYLLHAPQAGATAELLRVRLSDLTIQKRWTVPAMDGYATPLLEGGAIDPQGIFLYYLVSIPISGSPDRWRYSTVLKIRASDLTVVERIPIPDLRGVTAQGAVDPENRYYLALHDLSDSGPAFFLRIRLSDGQAQLANLSGPAYSYSTSKIGFDADANAAYVVFNNGDGAPDASQLLRIDLDTLQFRSFTSPRGESLLVPPKAKTAFLLRTEVGGGIRTFLTRVRLPELTSIDQRVLPIGQDPTDTAQSAAISPDGSILYVGVSSLRLGTTRTLESYRVSDLTKASLVIPRDAFGLEMNAAGTELYALGFGYLDPKRSAIAVIDTQTSAQPPAVFISSPASGTAFTAPARITLIATATAAAGITKVEFFQGVKALTVDTAAPYWITWQNVAPGTYTITAKATDATGSVAVSAPITLIVKKPSSWLPYNRHLEFSAPTREGVDEVFGDIRATFFDTCRLNDLGVPSATPTQVVHEGDLYTASAEGVCDLPDIVHLLPPRGFSLPVRARRVVASWQPVDGATAYNVYYGTASDLTGARRQRTSLPAFAVEGLSEGASYYFSASALNATGESARLGPAGPVVIGASPNVRPPYTIYAQVTREGEAAARTAIAALVKNLQEACLSVVLGTPSLGPLEILSNGPIYRGNQPVTCTPRPNIPPAVSISSPTSGAIYTSPARINLIANAADADGIAKVEFFAGAKALTTDTTAPYWITWQNVAPGAYTITARATDSAGITTVSAPISIIVSEPGQITGMASVGAPLASTVFVPATGPGIRVFPNPWRGNRDGGRVVTFDNLPANATLKLFTTSAHFVKTLAVTGATATWDVTNDAGQNVASGIYLYSVTAPQGDITGLLTVIR